MGEEAPVVELAAGPFVKPELVVLEEFELVPLDEAFDERFLFTSTTTTPITAPNYIMKR